MASALVRHVDKKGDASLPKMIDRKIRVEAPGGLHVILLHNLVYAVYGIVFLWWDFASWLSTLVVLRPRGTAEAYDPILSCAISWHRSSSNPAARCPRSLLL